MAQKVQLTIDWKWVMYDHKAHAFCFIKGRIKGWGEKAIYNIDIFLCINFLTFNEVSKLQSHWLE